MANTASFLDESPHNFVTYRTKKRSEVAGTLVADGGEERSCSTEVRAEHGTSELRVASV